MKMKIPFPPAKNSPNTLLYVQQWNALFGPAIPAKSFLCLWSSGTWTPLNLH